MMVTIVKWNAELGVKRAAAAPETWDQERVDAFIDDTWVNGGWFDLARMVHLVENGTLPGDCALAALCMLLWESASFIEENVAHFV